MRSMNGLETPFLESVWSRTPSGLQPEVRVNLDFFVLERCSDFLHRVDLVRGDSEPSRALPAHGCLNVERLVLASHQEVGVVLSVGPALAPR